MDPATLTTLWKLGKPTVSIIGKPAAKALAEYVRNTFSANERMRKGWERQRFDFLYGLSLEFAKQCGRLEKDNVDVRRLVQGLMEDLQFASGLESSR